MKSFTPFPNCVNDAVLFVTGYEKGAMTGWLMHPRLKHAEEVKSVPQLLLLLDDILHQDERMISNLAFGLTYDEESPRIATLHIQVLFQEHYTWQGLVRWEEEHKEASFRSVLELIQVLDEILAN